MNQRDIEIKRKFEMDKIKYFNYLIKIFNKKKYTLSKENIFQKIAEKFRKQRK